MLWLSFFLCVSALFLSGCGLRPALEQTDPSSHAHALSIKNVSVKIKGIEGYLNHVFYTELQKHLRLLKDKIKEPIFITITLSQSLYDVSYGKDATALRSQNVFFAFYEISQKKRRLKKGTVDSVSSYNLDNNDVFSTLTNRMGTDDAVVRALALEVAREVLMAVPSSTNPPT